MASGHSSFILLKADVSRLGGIDAAASRLLVEVLDDDKRGRVFLIAVMMLSCC